MADWREILVAHAGLSTRATNALRNGGFYTMGEVTRASTYELLCIPEFGRKSLNELEEWSAVHGAVAGERKRELERQVRSMELRIENLRKAIVETERHIEHAKSRLAA